VILSTHGFLVYLAKKLGAINVENPCAGSILMPLDSRLFIFRMRLLF
jgi:hypothetical protein